MTTHRKNLKKLIFSWLPFSDKYHTMSTCFVSTNYGFKSFANQRESMRISLSVFSARVGLCARLTRRGGHTVRLCDLRINRDLTSVIQEFQPDFFGIGIRNINDA
jgi:hypothetical protein